MKIGSDGFSIDPKEIEYIIKSVANYLEKDKNYLCLILSLTNKNIVNWEKEIKTFVSDQMVKQ